MTSRSRRDSVILAALWTAAFLADCSGMKPYQNTPDKNLHFHTAAESGSWFSSVRAAVDIHRLTADCRTEYEGTVQLNRPTVDLGVPPERWSRLVFVFLANRSGSMTYETLLKPRSGYQYEIDVTYRDDMYNVVVRETQPGHSVAHEVQPNDGRACQARSREGSRVSSHSSPR